MALIQNCSKRLTKPTKVTEYINKIHTYYDKTHDKFNLIKQKHNLKRHI